MALTNTTPASTGIDQSLNLNMADRDQRISIFSSRATSQVEAVSVSHLRANKKVSNQYTHYTTSKN